MMRDGIKLKRKRDMNKERGKIIKIKNRRGGEGRKNRTQGRGEGRGMTGRMGIKEKVMRKSDKGEGEERGG